MVEVMKHVLDMVEEDGKGCVSIGNISTGKYLSDTGELILKEKHIDLIRILNDEEVIGNGG